MSRHEFSLEEAREVHTGTFDYELREHDDKRIVIFVQFGAPNNAVWHDITNKRVDVQFLSDEESVNKPSTINGVEKFLRVMSEDDPGGAVPLTEIAEPRLLIFVPRGMRKIVKRPT